MGIIKEHENIKVSKLEKISKVPRTSLLRYLKELESQGKIVKFFGEVSLRKSSIESNAWPRINSSKTEKNKIAQLAAKKIKNGDIIFLDGGSTTYYLALKLYDRQISIYTNNILLANIVNDQYVPIVYFLSGKVNPKTLAISSAETILSIQKNKFDKCFLGFNSFNKQYFYTTNQDESAVKRAIISVTNPNGVFIIGRSSKEFDDAKFAFSPFSFTKLITERKK